MSAQAADSERAQAGEHPHSTAQGSAEAEPVASESRAVSPYSTKEKIGRLIWAAVQVTLWRCTFHNWYGVRAQILRWFGATIGSNVRIRSTVRIECPWNLTIGDNSSVGDGARLYCLGPVNIARDVSISQFAHICAGSHDFSTRDMPLLRPPITIERDAWIAADAFVGPDLTVGEGAILGARGCAFRDLDPWMIYGGNPARPMRERPRFVDSE